MLDASQLFAKISRDARKVNSVLNKIESSVEQVCLISFKEDQFYHFESKTIERYAAILGFKIGDFDFQIITNYEDEAAPLAEITIYNNKINNLRHKLNVEIADMAALESVMQKIEEKRKDVFEEFLSLAEKK